MSDHLGEREEIWLESLDFCHMPSALMCQTHSLHRQQTVVPPVCANSDLV